MPETDIPIPALPRSPGQQRDWREPAGSSLALLLCEAARQRDGVIVAVTADSRAARTLEDELGVFADGLPVLHFPDWETLPYDLFAPHPQLVSQRIDTLYRLPATRKGVLVVPVATLMQRLAPRSHIAGSGLAVARGQQLDLADEQRRLETCGYRHVPQVGEHGEFAVRGALLDVFPMGASEPYRIELFDDAIESIRAFDPETQRSLHQVDAVKLLPAREFPLTDEAMRAFRDRLRERFPIDVRRCPLYQDMKQGVTPSGIEYYLPLFFDATESLFDYLGDDALFVLGRGALEAAEPFWKQTEARYDQRAHDIERPVLPPMELYLPPQSLRERLNNVLRIDIVAPDDPRAVDTGTQAAPDFSAGGPQAGGSAARLRGWLESHPGTRVLIAADSPGRREALLEQLSAVEMQPQIVDGWPAFLGKGGPLSITSAPLERGFTLTQPPIAVFTERELAGERARSERQRRRVAERDPEAILRDLSELEIGAPIVHVDHGVGRYLGLVALDVGGMPGEFLAIEYARGDKLYVPVAQLALVSRYSGADDEHAPLHSLGGESWERAKRKAAGKVRDVAAELLAIHAQRAARQGNAIDIDRSMLARFAEGFPFEETPDQQAAIDAVLADLEARQPMDRVVCGDVGFGKTEVALRAAVAAASAGKQVAVLVPTTLLAQQHYDNFRDRLADFPIRVELLSRFRAKKDADDALKRLADGKLDIVVGTHKLLQPDVKFKDLGLVIVDEEHRFGVRHKEQLKKLRAEVDLLTLTATPIPRTLNMAMSGMRDLSIIATPPAARMAVKTLVAQYDPALVREAFQRELARGGQVYFLHNSIDSIQRVARELGELVPDARIRVAHGQMSAHELEQAMLDFHRQRFNVLVCTTIIESGIDVPTANTIVIDRADRFGLAQLHQLRGRVGRSHHRAYAYLIVPDRNAITADAEKRLAALESLEELGAGFTLATHDMEIRGAGELLGEAQSGQIEAIGFALYNDLLERAVRALRSGKVPDFDLGGDTGTEIELHLPALIPDDYLPDVHARLTLYKRIASATEDEGLRDLQVEMIDRFGLLPQATKNLFAIASLKLRAHALGIRKLDLGAAAGRITFRAKPDVDPATIIRLIQKQPRVYKLDGQDKLRIAMELPEPADRLRMAGELLETLAARAMAA
ncbi:MAG: transcription-repair coupling factor [Xanthomonadales bacterium]|nr:transcription-repair coupling factor [Xanthomonadales bacterium]ODU92739.1 MAG: transcription-repair coupling factor [Rhodanobacter sp. SCN 66-43]OJY83897.1 MAG: transcription-repair coupling factor [Xanthomonadales bacterium 66-474]